MNLLENKTDLNRLIAKIRDKDQEAFGLLFDSYWNRAYYYCHKLLKNKQDAEDATQEAFLMLHRRIKNTTGPFLVEKNIKWDTSTICRRYLQKRERVTGADMLASIDELVIPEEREEFLPGELLSRKELQTQVMRLVENLPDKQREVILLHYFNGFSQVEIAKMTKSAQGTVKSHLFSAKKKLRQQADRLIQSGELGTMAAIPVLTRLFEQEAGQIATPRIKAEIWQRVNKGLDTCAPNRAQTAKAAQTTGRGFKFMAGALSVLAVAGLITGSVFLHKATSTPTAGTAIDTPATGLDIIEALLQVKTQAQFDVFFEKYGMANRQGRTEPDGYTYVLCAKELPGRGKLIAAYRAGNGGFDIAYQLAEPGSAMPEQVKEWVVGNLQLTMDN